MIDKQLSSPLLRKTIFESQMRSNPQPDDKRDALTIELPILSWSQGASLTYMSKLS